MLLLVISLLLLLYLFTWVSKGHRDTVHLGIFHPCLILQTPTWLVVGLKKQELRIQSRLPKDSTGEPSHGPSPQPQISQNLPWAITPTSNQAEPPVGHHPGLKSGRTSREPSPRPQIRRTSPWDHHPGLKAHVLAGAGQCLWRVSQTTAPFLLPF